MEELVRASGDEEMRSEMFICGVFSLLDRMFQQPFERVARHASRCRSASIRRWSRKAGPYQPYVELVRAIENESLFDFRDDGRDADDERSARSTRPS